MLTDRELVEAYLGPDVGVITPGLVKALRRVESAVREQCRATLKAVSDEALENAYEDGDPGTGESPHSRRHRHARSIQAVKAHLLAALSPEPANQENQP